MSQFSSSQSVKNIHFSDKKLIHSDTNWKDILFDNLLFSNIGNENFISPNQGTVELHFCNFYTISIIFVNVKLKCSKIKKNQLRGLALNFLFLMLLCRAHSKVYLGIKKLWRTFAVATKTNTYSKVQKRHKLQDWCMQFYNAKDRLCTYIFCTQQFRWLVITHHSQSAKAAASKVSERPVPVLKVTFSDEASGV